MAVSLSAIYKLLLGHFGPQHWWPGDSPFEVVVGGDPQAMTKVSPWLQRLGAALEAVRPQSQAPVQILQEGRRAGLKATLDQAQLESALGKLGLPHLKLQSKLAPKSGAKA